MKSLLYIALAVFLGTVAVQGYGPKIHRKKHGSPQKLSHWSHNRPSHGPHHGPPQKPHHHGPPQKSHDRPSHDNGPPNQHNHWDNSPVWDDRSDSRDSSQDGGSFDSYGSDDSYGPEDSYGPDDYSRERDSLDRSRPSYEDYGDWHDHHHSKHPCKQPHNKKPLKTTPKPMSTTPKATPTTPKPIPPTHRIPLTPTLPPHPAHTRFTPKPTGTTAGWKTNPTTPLIIPGPTRTVGPIPRPPITTASRPIWHPTPPIEDTTHWETTTNSVPEITSFNPLPTTTTNPEVETTTAEEEAFPTISPEIEECINFCLSTPEYNPVCGSNGVTYNNEGKLFCASSCGVNVTLVRRSVCPPPNFDYDDDTETPPPATTTTPPFHGRTTPLSDFQRCMRLCRITASFIPVCGTDLVTYMNMDRLKCAQSCGEVVEVLCEKPCAACGFNPVKPKTTTTLRPSTTPQTGRTTQEPDVQECINACPVTSEYNPVCGSNHVTYSNPSHLICDQLCGVGVTVTRLGPCGPTTTSSTTTVAPSPTLSPDVLSCIQRCPVTAEYDPVCGTDDLTYTNLGNLHCSRFCGVEVDFKHKSRCVDEFDLGPDGTDSTPSQTTQNINGNKDRVTTPWRSTATTPSLFTSPTTTTTAPSSTTTISSSTTNAGPNSSSTTLGFTIPHDVLIDIFGSTTTQAPITKPKNPDEDEDLDLDARFNNETDSDKDTGRGHYSKIIFPD